MRNAQDFKSNITGVYVLVSKTSKEGSTMSETVLLRFLESGLINVGGDDAKLEKLRATAEAVSEF